MNKAMLCKNPENPAQDGGLTIAAGLDELDAACSCASASRLESG
jgi:hypothetical protein